MILKEVYSKELNKRMVRKEFVKADFDSYLLKPYGQYEPSEEPEMENFIELNCFKGFALNNEMVYTNAYKSGLITADEFKLDGVYIMTDTGETIEKIV